MLYYVLLTLYVLVSLLLLVVVLLQQGKGGDIAAAFGGSSSQTAFGARAGATVLTRATTVLGTLFMVIRDLAIAILPIIPESAGKLLDQMGIAADARDFAAIEDQSWYDVLRASGYKVARPVPLFPRLELEIAED